MGSVAENVVRASVFPTLVVKGADLAPGQKTLSRQLCPVDLTQSAAEFLDTSASLACAFGAKLDVLRVLPNSASDVQLEKDRLQQWVPDVVRQRCSIFEAVHRGDVAEQIVMFARQQAVDLIVVGVEPRRFLEFTVLGRTTERVVRHGPCSVLLFRLEPRCN